MKYLSVLLLLMSACTAPRVLVKDDCDKAGPGLLNCPKVQDL